MKRIAKGAKMMGLVIAISAVSLIFALPPHQGAFAGKSAFDQGYDDGRVYSNSVF